MCVTVLWLVFEICYHIVDLLIVLNLESKINFCLLSLLHIALVNGEEDNACKLIKVMRSADLHLRNHDGMVSLMHSSHDAFNKVR